MAPAGVTVLNKPFTYADLRTALGVELGKQRPGMAPEGIESATKSK